MLPEKQHLSNLLEAIQHCAFFLHASTTALAWPLTGEQADSFIRVLSIFEKHGVLDSVEDWQIARAARNLAAHDYETSYDNVAEHFNALRDLEASLYGVASRFVRYCETELGVLPASRDFTADFLHITST